MIGASDTLSDQVRSYCYRVRGGRSHLYEVEVCGAQIADRRLVEYSRMISSNEIVSSKDTKDMLQSKNALANGRMLTALRSTDLAGDPVPSRLLIAPWGQVRSSNGEFLVDDESARLVIEAFQEHATDLPIDYEHQTLGGRFSSPNGQAPAAGWITAIESEPNVGLFALVNWTEAAQSQLRSKEYRYLSPVAIVRKSDRKLVAVHSVALTNKPAIVGMEPIVNRCELDDDAAGRDVVALREMLDLPTECSDVELLAAASRRLRAMSQELEDRRIGERLEHAVRSGRLSSANRDWARRLLVCDEALFDEWLSCSVPVVTLGRLATEPTGSEGQGDRVARSRARSEFRSHPELAAITSEEAYIELALQDADATGGRIVA